MNGKMAKKLRKAAGIKLGHNATPKFDVISEAGNDSIVKQSVLRRYYRRLKKDFVKGL